MILGGVLQNNLRAIKEFSLFIPQNVWWTYSNNYVYLKYMVLLTLRIEICRYEKCLRLAQKFLIRKTQSWFLICEKFLKTYLIFKELTELLTGFFPIYYKYWYSKEVWIGVAIFLWCYIYLLKQKSSVKTYRRVL